MVTWPSGPGRSTGYWVGTVKALVIDNDRAIRDLLVTAFESRGMSATTCCDGAAAQRALAVRADYDIVVLGLALRGNDGWGLLRWVRTHSSVRQLPVVLLTGRSIVCGHACAWMDTVSAVISKGSFSMRYFDRAVNKALAG